MKLKAISLASLSALALCVSIRPAHAQYFTNHDGYTDDGQYRVQVELSPYLWLPATSGSIGFAHPDIVNHISGTHGTISGDIGTAVPSVNTLAESLHFSFMGDGLLRYGPYSAEVDLQYVSAFGSKTIFTHPDGSIDRLHVDASYVRIAPGLGYQVYSGDVFSIPTSVDARAGFAYFANWKKLQGEGDLTGGIGNSGNFVQPWVGTRIDFIPAPSWRIELTAMVQGFGVDNGSWGWGASAIVSYAVSSWFDVNAGYRALNSERNQGNLDTPGSAKRSLDLTAYGPVVGFSLRFGSSPPPPPAPSPVAPVAAPAPVAAQTYLVFFDWDKADLSPRATQIIAQAAADSKNQNVTTIEANGYTDTSGTVAYNQGLSIRRAKAVATQLVADGVPESEITAQGFGDTHLLVPTGPGVREPQNRRVEIIVH
jgi:outer membrane protein OmpA-like peptidoglycan-associated protein